MNNKGIWTGRALSGLLVLFMLFDSILKLLNLAVVQEAMQPLGWPAGHARGIAALELALTVVYVFPRTSVLGAVLLTGLLGGTVATHLRVGDPLFSHVLFGVYLGLFAWGGLFLRDPQLRALFPWRR